MIKFSCPYLSGDVELSDERQRHIAIHHPDLLPEYLDRIEKTLAAPDQIRSSSRFLNARLFTRWFDDVKKGKFVVVVVVTDGKPNVRHWIITAYIARKLSSGEIEWQKS